MEVKKANLLDILEVVPQFVVPIYQRTYSWTEKECRQLWDDILRAGKGNAAHFTGSIVYMAEKELIGTPFLLIDGQQRLTTVSLLLAALSRRLSETLGDNELMHGCSAQQIRTNYLVNCKEDGERYYKLLLSQTDKESLKVIVGDAAEPSETSIRIRENFKNFKKWIDNEAKSSNNLREVWKGIKKLKVVEIGLIQGEEKPQLIFERMNSTGRVLSQGDLIRNFILMGLKPEIQTELYKNHWRPMEEEFGQKGYSTHFDVFMRHYLTVKNRGSIPHLREVYESFKRHAAKDRERGTNCQTIVKELQEYAKYYCAMALEEKEKDDLLKQAFQDLRELVGTAYPLLLELYRDYYKKKKLSRDDFHSILRMIEAYVFRRAICEIPTNSLNKTFSTFYSSIKEDHYLESVKAHFLGMQSNKRFPSDKEFASKFQSRDLYHFRSNRYWLRRFETFKFKEKVIIDENITIEHIMPQNMSPAWEKDLGPDCSRVHEELLHTVGNLTFTGYNSEYSDKPFKEKRDMKNGFRESKLHVNKDLGAVEKWDESAIKARASRLSEDALTVWPFPKASTGNAGSLPD